MLKKCIKKEEFSFSNVRKKNFILEKANGLKSEIIFYPNILRNTDWLKNLPEKNSPHFIISDKNVDSLYGKSLESLFRQEGYIVKKLIVPPGDKSKSFKIYKYLADTIISSGVNKNSYVIGFGGGVINNISGFLASTIYRGIGLIHIPTTLLAQADAAIDFKQAINSSFGKNHLGSYYAASKIFIDPSFLQTLPGRQIKNGLAEVIKHALTQDKKLLRFLSKNTKQISDLNFLYQIIYRTISLKVHLLNGDRDFKSADAEMIMQYGHPIAHALEHISRYRLLHGEALSIGMCIMAEISHLLGICDDSMRNLHYQIIRNYDLPTCVPKRIADKNIVNSVKYDKHFIQKVHSILIENPGIIAQNKKSYIFEIPTRILKEALILNRTR